MGTLVQAFRQTFWGRTKHKRPNFEREDILWNLKFNLGQKRFLKIVLSTYVPVMMFALKHLSAALGTHNPWHLCFSVSYISVCLSPFIPKWRLLQFFEGGIRIREKQQSNQSPFLHRHLGLGIWLCLFKATLLRCIEGKDSNNLTLACEVDDVRGNDLR